MKRFVVVDEEGHTSFNAKAGAPEAFSTFKAAQARAEALAALAPGQTIGIYELAAKTVCPVAPVVTTSLCPREGATD